MSNLVPGQIPASALPTTGGTIEQLALWALLALKEANGTNSSVEEPGGPSLRLFDYQVISAPDGSTRILWRANIKVDPTYLTSDTQQFWEFAQEASTGELPANYVV